MDKCACQFLRGHSSKNGFPVKLHLLPLEDSAALIEGSAPLFSAKEKAPVKHLVELER